MSGFNKLLSAELLPAKSIADQAFDGVIVVGHCLKELKAQSALSGLYNTLEGYFQLNAGARDSTSLIPIDKSIVPSGRLIYSGTGPVHRDFDDVRSYKAAAQAGVRLALSAGLKAPILATVPHKRFPQAELVSVLGSLHPLYVPLNVRDDGVPRRMEKLGLLAVQQDQKTFVHLAEAFEASFTVCRDVGDSDPIRMAPPRVGEYIEDVFKGGNVKVSVISNPEEIQKDYPMMAAVNRCANHVKSHQARLIKLEYDSGDGVDETVMMVGKGVTIDTGGTDIKTGGHMFGMSRDKYGSAIVGGFFKALDVLKPKKFKAIGYMCMVRNSIGSDAYTCDEVIKCRSGKRIHIYNTDAEGRLTMLDPLTHMREMAVNERNAHLMTIATLTGHEVLTHGFHGACLDNGPAVREKYGYKLQATGDEYGQPVEVDRLKAEDFKFHLAESPSADLRQGNTIPSTQTLRGHHTPAAFLQMASRIDEHGLDSDKPLKYSHLDIGSAMGDMPDVTFPNPLVALVAHHVIPRS
ncbi:hypothetical protein QR680_013805 [Steinernema hermaphroditum]|uniref:Cytosol aminopeptidase domain-containing protein n=1 Tax=Steinernema hermaphroditum TaxID=289476 RepID=A0AA39M2V7_9BILA|nr:hypothetical protein QR680_013805 [Steinernema hermaphroditum]